MRPPEADLRPHSAFGYASIGLAAAGLALAAFGFFTGLSPAVLPGTGQARAAPNLMQLTAMLVSLTGLLTALAGFGQKNVRRTLLVVGLAVNSILPVLFCCLIGVGSLVRMAGNITP